MTRALGALSLTVCLGVTLTGVPASAATPTDLYVNNTSSNCSDDGSGTQEQPFCTLAAASSMVTAGQTVHIVAGTYNERLTVDRSGTPEAPITFRTDQGDLAHLSGPAAGITIDGQHDVAVIGFNVIEPLADPAITLSNSTRITLSLTTIWASLDAPSTGIRLAAVTDSLISEAGVESGAAGIALDASSSRVTIEKSWVLTYLDSSTAIELKGQENRVVNTEVSHAGTAIRIPPGGHGNIIANNVIHHGPGRGIHNSDADNTVITNNRVDRRCGTGIRVDGTSSGVSVQNNVASGNGEPVRYGCDPASPADEVNIGLYDEAAGSTVVDFNNVYSYNGRSMYAWRGAPIGLAAFRTASGQAAHDLETDDEKARIDSANSAAPGWQSTDPLGRVRVDDPSRPNTGSGPISYADRGESEHVAFPTAAATATAQRTRAGTLVTVNASASTVWIPLTIKYTFDFGDGTPPVTQNTPIATHTYRGQGSYTVMVRVTDSNGLTNSHSFTGWTYVMPPRCPAAPSRWVVRSRTAR